MNYLKYLNISTLAMNPNAMLFHTVVMILHFLVIIAFRKKVCGA